MAISRPTTDLLRPEQGTGVATDILAVSLSLSPNATTKFQDADWTIAASSGNLRLTKGTAGAVDWDQAGTVDGLCLIYADYSIDFSSGSMDGIYEWRFRVQASEPSANGVGYGIGLVNNSSAPTAWCAILAERAASGTENITANSDLATDALVAAGARKNGLVLEVTAYDLFRVGRYNASAATTYADATSEGPTWEDLSGATWYPAVFAVAGAAGGCVDITELKLVDRTLDWGD